MTKCLLDIGTNTFGGYRKLKEILHIDDNWEKIFIEPNPEHYENIKRTIVDIPNSIYLEVAIAPENKEYELLTRDDMKGDSAATIMGMEFITNSIGSVNQAIPSYLAYKVQGMTLDSILQMVKSDEIYIKVDAEGIEYDLLENFPKQYLPKIKKIYVEFHAHTDEMRGRQHEIIQYYKSCGIELLNWD